MQPILVKDNKANGVLITTPYMRIEARIKKPTRPGQVRRPGSMHALLPCMRYCMWDAGAAEWMLHVGRRGWHAQLRRALHAGSNGH